LADLTERASVFSMSPGRPGRLGLDHLDVRDQVDLAGDVDHVLVVEAADDVDDRVGLADVGQELVAGPSPWTHRRPGRSVGADELDDRRDDPLGLDDRRQLRQARIRAARPRRRSARMVPERVVLGRDSGFGEGR
jgi:hypothetical protein